MLAGYLATRIARPQRYAMNAAQQEAIRNYLYLNSRGEDLENAGPLAMGRPWYFPGRSATHPLIVAHGRNPLLNQLLHAAYYEHDPGAYAAYLDQAHDILGPNSTYNQGGLSPDYLINPMQHLLNAVEPMHHEPGHRLVQAYGPGLRPGGNFHAELYRALTGGLPEGAGTDGHVQGSYIYPMEDMAMHLRSIPELENLRGPRQQNHSYNQLQELAARLNQQATHIQHGGRVMELPASLDTQTQIGDHLYRLMQSHVEHGGQAYEVPELSHMQDHLHELENHGKNIIRYVVPNIEGA